MTIEVTHINNRIEIIDAIFDDNVRHQYETLSLIYNHHVGPVSSVNLFRPDLLDLSMYGTSCHHSKIGLLNRDLLAKGPLADTLPIPIGGKGASLQQAFFGNLGEAAERLLAALYSGEVLGDVEVATYSNLARQGRRALGPLELPLFAPEQYARPGFGYVPFEPDTPLSWIEGNDLLTGDPVLVPAQLTLFYWKRLPSEARIGYATSGGLVFHPNRKHAILHGIYESIERDAENLRWYCKLPPVRVDVDLEELLASRGIQWRPRMSTPYIDAIQVFLNTLDVPIPVFTALSVDRSRRERALLAGGGAWGRRERALVQAIFEIGQMRTGYRLSPNAWTHVRPDSDVSDLTDFYDAPTFYGYVQNLPKLSWYLSGAEVLSWSDTPTVVCRDEDEEYEMMIDLMGKCGINPIVIDLSGSSWSGTHLIKVFVPQLTQAHVPSHPYFGHRRYYEIKTDMGIDSKRMSFSEVNKEPLPFP